MVSNRDWHLISLNNITPESNIKVMKIKEMIINLLKKLLIVKQILLVSISRNV